MNEDMKDKMIMNTLLERFQKQRLPRLLDIKKAVDQGDKLGNFDMEFLEEVFSDTRQNQHYLEAADDELKSLFMKALSLYNEITKKALENEQKG